MALQFFRRRQKLVIFIMVILMVSFLIGGFGFRWLTQRTGGDQPVGVSKFGKIRWAEVYAAEGDLFLLGELNRNVRDYEYGTILANEGQAPLVYALLLREADESPVIVTDRDVNTFLAQRGWRDEQLANLIARLQTRMSGMNTDRLREAIGRWLKVQKLFTETALFATCPARLGAECSEQQLRHLYRDVVEQIDLRVVTVGVEKFLEDVEEPNAAQVQAQFEAYRAQPPGTYSEDNPFGFGYAQPPRAGIRYLWIRQDVLARVARPTEAELRAHYIRHRDRYVAPDSDNGEPMTFAEVKDRIAQELSTAAVREAVDEVLAQAAMLADQYASENPAATGDAYTHAVSRMTGSAEQLLATELSDVRIQARPLAEAVDLLASEADLLGIAFPWGQQGETFLDPNVKVTLQAERMTLGEALDAICRQVKYPTLQWATLSVLPRTLFAVGGEDGINFFPLQVRQTGLLDMKAILQDEVLGQSFTSANEPLARMVFTAQPFQEKSGQGGMKVGDEGPRMEVKGAKRGRLLWRLTAARPAHVPQRLEDVPGLAEQVAEDIRVRQAFEQAVKAAEELQEQASEKGLAATAKKAGIETLQTGPFSRKVVFLVEQQIEAMARLTGRTVSLPQLAIQRPVVYPLSEVEGLDLGGDVQKRQFIEAAFDLVPEDVEPPYPTAPPAVGLLSLPLSRKVLVMERTDYRPPVISQYAEAKSTLARQLEAIDMWRSRVAWFSAANVIQRMRFQPSRRADNATG